MRLLALAVWLVGCDPRAEDDVYPGFPDAATCDIGGFSIAAPRPELHYAPSMEVYVDESELLWELTLTMTDSQGRAYSWTDEGSQANPGGVPTWNHDRFHYDLTPNERYTLTVSHCTMRQSVVFFTSSS